MKKRTNGNDESIQHGMRMPSDITVTTPDSGVFYLPPFRLASKVTGCASARRLAAARLQLAVPPDEERRRRSWPTAPCVRS